METINVRLPAKQLRILKKEVKKLNYPSFSEYVREALRRMMESSMDLGEDTVAAIHEARGQKSVSHSRVKKTFGL